MNVYGPRQDYKGAYIAVMMKILDRIDQGLPPIVYGDGLQSYDFIHVSDVAHATLCASRRSTACIHWGSCAMSRSSATARYAVAAVTAFCRAALSELLEV